MSRSGACAHLQNIDALHALEHAIEGGYLKETGVMRRQSAKKNAQRTIRSFSLSPVSVIAPKREAKGHCERKSALFSGVGGRIRNSFSAACIENNL